jgi:hypothetical protein
MRENGFLETSWSEKSVVDLLNRHERLELITAQPVDRMTAVVALMKEYDISQVPVMDATAISPHAPKWICSNTCCTLDTNMIRRKRLPRSSTRT